MKSIYQFSITLVLFFSTLHVGATECLGEYQLQAAQDNRCMRNIKFVEIDYFNHYKAVVNEYEMNKLDKEIELLEFQNQKIHEVFYQPVYGISFDNIHDSGAYAAGTIHLTSIRFIKEYRNASSQKTKVIKDSNCFRDELIFDYKKIIYPRWYFADEEVTEIRCRYDRLP